MSMVHFLNPGFSYFRNPSLTATVVDVKTLPGNLYGLTLINVNTVPVYVKFFNATAANVVLGTTAPFKVFAIPASDGNSPGEIIATPDDLPISHFNTAISFVAVIGVADSSITAPSSVIHTEVILK